MELLQGLEIKQDGTIFIEAPFAINKTAEMVVPPHKFADMTAFFDEHEIENEVKINNLQK